MKTSSTDFIDIVKDSVTGNDYKVEEDPTIYASAATGRGPLSPNWREEFTRAQKMILETYERPPTRTPDNTPATEVLKPLPKRIMCAYKLCRVEFRYWGTQTRVEQFIHDTGMLRLVVFCFLNSSYSIFIQLSVYL
ncbi:unnamed protein product [Trichobilharzia regenti]|nr:unnamed protein product [Trichobilharzia regenti]